MFDVRNKSHSCLKACVAVFLLTTSSMGAYPEAVAYVGAGVSGGLAGIVAHSATQGTILEPFRFPLTLLVSSGVGYGAYRFLMQFTPAGRYKRAADRVAWVERFEFARMTYTNEQFILNQVNRLYRTRSWPLIAAFDDLVLCTQKLNDAWDLAQAACDEEFAYADKAAKLQDKITVFLNNIDPVLAAIKNCPEYLKQLEQAREEQRRQQELAIQQQIANAQTSNANAQWYNANANHKIANAQMINANNGRRW